MTDEEKDARIAKIRLRKDAIRRDKEFQEELIEKVLKPTIRDALGVEEAKDD